MRIAILGCGYVGLELGRQLVDRGHAVVGVRRSADGLASIDRVGFEPIGADVTDPNDLEAVPSVDAIVFAASPSVRSDAGARALYVDGLRTVVDSFAARRPPPDRLVYTSSTGVYGDHDGEWVDETSTPQPATHRGRLLLDAERVARSHARSRGIDGTVVRFAGLYGPDRYRLERYLEGPVTEGWLNLLHRDDAAGVVRFLLESDRGRDRTVLAVDDEPVWRPTLAGWLAEQVGRPAPAVRSLEDRLADPDLSDRRRARIAAQKRCSNDGLRALGYEFAYPTYRAGYRAAIADRA